MGIAKDHPLAWRVIVIVVCVILALAMTIPSIAVLLSGANRDEAETEQQQEQVVEEAPGVPDATTSVADTDAYFQELTDALTQTVAENPDNTTALRQLGNSYFDWARALTEYHADDAEAVASAQQHWTQAVETYQAYLEISPSSAIAVDCAIATYYSGDVDGAISQLQTVTADTPDYVQAWLNLGVFSAEQGQTDTARDAFQHVLDLDPNDTMGYKSAVEQMMAEL